MGLLPSAPRMGWRAARSFFDGPIGAEALRLTPRELFAQWAAQTADMRAGRVPKAISLYVHIPFCPRLCSYCIYYRVKADSAQIAAYLERLHQEIDLYAPLFAGLSFNTLYIGGGTPTLLDETQLEALLAHLAAAFTRAKGCGEWAFETSPDTLSAAKAALFKRYGYNRASFGVQSLRAEVLRGVNRSEQSATQVAAALALLREAGILSCNVDLLHGLPGQTLSDTQESLCGLMDAKAPQITLYALLPSTPLDLDFARIAKPEELAPALAETAHSHGYEMRVYPQSLVFVRIICDWTFDYFYSDVSPQPQSLLAFGPSARGRLCGRLSYRHEPYPVDEAFAWDRAQSGYVPCDLPDEMRRYLLLQLEQEGEISAAAYQAIFDEALALRWGECLDELCALGYLCHSPQGYAYAVTSPQERFEAELGLLGEEWLKARQGGEDASPGDSEARRLLNIDWKGQRTRLVLIAAKEPQPRFHEGGGFALFFDDNDRDNALPSLLTPLLTRLFDLVVHHDAPSSLDELGDHLLRRAAALGPCGLLLRAHGAAPDSNP